MRTCDIRGCDNPTHARCLCYDHYWRDLRYGDPEAPPRRRTTCQVEGCEEKHRARGFCEKHYHHHRYHHNKRYRQKCIARSRKARRNPVYKDRYSLEPLIECLKHRELPPTFVQLSRHLGRSDKYLGKIKERGGTIPWWEADRLAAFLRLHPGHIWPEYYTVQEEVA